MFLTFPFVITFIFCLVYISSLSIWFGITWLYSRYDKRQSENLNTTTAATTTTDTEDQRTPAAAAPTEEPALVTFTYENERILEEAINVILIWIHQNKVEQLSSVTNRMAEHQTEMSLSKSVLIELFSVYRQSRLQAMLDFMNDRNTDDVDSHKLAGAVATLMMFALGIRIDIQDQLDSPFVNSLLILRDSLQVSRDPYMCDFMLYALTEESVASAVLLKELTRENPNHIINYETAPDFTFINKFMENQFMAPIPVTKPSLVSRIPLLNLIAPVCKRMVGSSPLEKDIQLKLFEDYATDALKDINHLQADFWSNVQENFNDNDDDNSTEGTQSPPYSPSPILPEDSVSIDIPQAANPQGPLQHAHTRDPLQPANTNDTSIAANITQALPTANTHSGHTQDAPSANTRNPLQASTEFSISPLSGTPPSGSTASSIRNIINMVKAEYPVDPPPRNVTFAPDLVVYPLNNTGAAFSSALPANTRGDLPNPGPIPAKGTIDGSLQNPPPNYSSSDFGTPVGALGHTVIGNTALLNITTGNTTNAASASGGPAAPTENNNDSVHVSSSAAPIENNNNPALASSSAAPVTSSASPAVDDPLVFNDHDCEILDLNDEDREAFDRLATHPSQATFNTVSDLRMKYTEVENRLSEILFIKENVDVFNKMHALCTMGTTFSGVPSRLNQVTKAYKALIKQFKDFHDYIQEYERAFVFYQARALVDAYKTETRYLYEDAAGNTASAQVTIDELARLGGYVHKSIRMVFTLECVFEKYVACSTVFQDTYKQREYRNAIQILSDESYGYANGYKAIERAFYTREMENLDLYADPV